MITKCLFLHKVLVLAAIKPTLLSKSAFIFFTPLCARLNRMAQRITYRTQQNSTTQLLGDFFFCHLQTFDRRIGLQALSLSHRL